MKTRGSGWSPVEDTVSSRPFFGAAAVALRAGDGLRAGDALRAGDLSAGDAFGAVAMRRADCDLARGRPRGETVRFWLRIYRSQRAPGGEPEQHRAAAGPALATKSGAPRPACPTGRAAVWSTILALCTCVARAARATSPWRGKSREARTEERRNSAERALFDGHNSSSRLLKRPEARERFACFLSHYKIQCASEARLLQAELEASLGRRCFLDSDDLKDLRQLADHVRSSDVLVLIQSSEVLSRPWCLLELLTAIDAGVPIVGVAITAGPAAYDFRAAAALMGELDVPGRLDASAAQLLDEHGHTLEDAAWKLSSVLPQVISVPLDPFASRAVLAATVHDTVEAMRAARRGQLPDKAEWLRSRERPAAMHGAAAAAPAAASASVPAQVPPLPDSLAACFPEGSSRKAMLADICKRLSEAGIAPAPAALPPALREHLMKRKESGEELLAEELEALNLPGATDGGAPAKPPTVVAARGIGGAGKTSLAVGVVLQKSMQEHFEAIVWTSAGQTPVLPALLRAQLAQLRRGADAGAGAGAGGDSDDVDALREAAQAAAKGRRVLLVLDDVWEPAHERALNFVTASDDGSAVLVTTRIRALVPESDEVEVGALSKREAVALLLRSGGIVGRSRRRPRLPRPRLPSCAAACRSRSRSPAR